MGNKPTQIERIESLETPENEPTDSEILEKWLQGRLLNYRSITPKFLDDNWNFISNNRHLMEKLSRLNQYINITEGFVEQHLTSNWNWNELSNHVSLTFVENHPEFNWEWTFIAMRPDISDHFLEKFSDKPIDWYDMSDLIRGYQKSGIFRQNFSVSLKFIQRHPDKNWNWSAISRRYDVTLEFLTQFSEKPLDWVHISGMTDLTPRFIHRFQHKLYLNDNISNILDKFVEKKEKEQKMREKLKKTAELLGAEEESKGK